MKPIRWGVLGTANIFKKKLLPAMKESELVEIYAVASRSAEKAEETAREHKIPIWFGSYEELLADDTIEAVYIPLPNHLHAEWSKKAANAGKQVLCEKPFAMNAKEGEEAIDTIHSRGVLFMEAFMYRFHPQWAKAKELIQQGEIGDIRTVHSMFSYNLPDPKNIRNIKEWGGGGLMDIGCYCVSAARYLIGREPKRVMASIQRDPEFGTDMLTSAVLDFDGIHAAFTVSTRAQDFQHVSVLGSNGAIDIERPFQPYKDSSAGITLDSGPDHRRIEVGTHDQYQLMLEAFSRAIRNGDTAPRSPEDAINNQRVLDALFASETSGRWEDIST